MTSPPTFDVARFRRDVVRWIEAQGYGGRMELQRRSQVSAATLSRLLDAPGKLSCVHSFVKLAYACNLKLDDYWTLRRKDYIFV